MKTKLERGMGIRVLQLMAVAVSMVLVLGITAGAIGTKAQAAGDYVLEDRSVTELMDDFGVICFDTLYAQTHLHSNFITKTLDANANSGLRSSYGVYEEFYFENADRMCCSISDSAADTLYTGANVRRAESGEIYIVMNDGSEVKLDSPANVVPDVGTATDTDYRKYADMADIQSRFVSYNKDLTGYKDTTGLVDVSLSDDINNRHMTVNGSGLHVVTMSASELTTSTNPIYFEFPDYTDQTVLLVNIDMSGAGDVTFGDLILGSREAAKANDNDNYNSAYNRMYFNFYDSLAADGQYTGALTFAGRGFGTIIAPNAAVNLCHNWDGCVVSEIFSNGGEFHRVPGTRFPEEEPTTENTTTEDTTTETTTEDTTTEDTTMEDTTTETTTEDTTTEDTTTETTTENTTTEDTTTEDTTTEDTTTETTTEDTTTEDTTTETTTEDTTTEDTTTETTTEDTTTEDTTTEDTTTEDTTTEDTTTEDTTTDTTTENTTRTTWNTTESTTFTTVTMTTTRYTPPSRHPDTGDRIPVKEAACVTILAIIGCAGIVVYKKRQRKL